MIEMSYTQIIPFTKTDTYITYNDENVFIDLLLPFIIYMIIIFSLFVSDEFSYLRSLEKLVLFSKMFPLPQICSHVHNVFKLPVCTTIELF